MERTPPPPQPSTPLLPACANSGSQRGRTNLSRDYLTYACWQGIEPTRNPWALSCLVFEVYRYQEAQWLDLPPFGSGLPHFWGLVCLRLGLVCLWFGSDLPSFRCDLPSLWIDLICLLLGLIYLLFGSLICLFFSFSFLSDLPSFGSNLPLLGGLICLLWDSDWGLACPLVAGSAGSLHFNIG